MHLSGYFFPFGDKSKAAARKRKKQGKGLRSKKGFYAPLKGFLLPLRGQREEAEPLGVMQKRAPLVGAELSLLFFPSLYEVSPLLLRPSGCKALLFLLSGQQSRGPFGLLPFPLLIPPFGGEEEAQVLLLLPHLSGRAEPEGPAGRSKGFCSAAEAG